MSATKQGRWDVEHYFIDDYRLKFPAGMSDEEIAAHPRLGPEVRRRRYSFTALCWHPGRGSLFCGVTNTGGNILHEFNPAKGTFRSLGFAKVARQHEHKIHKGLWLDADQNALYFGAATLSDIPELVKAPGGRLMRYDIDTGKYTPLGIPAVNSYIQATNYDRARKLLYSFGICDYGFAVWSLARKKLIRGHAMGSIVHVTDFDDAGGIWGTYGAGSHALFRYDPDKNEFQTAKHGVLPTARQGANIMYAGAGPIDCLINGRDGLLYIGTALGELYQLDPRSFDVTYLGRPFPHNRLPALCIGEDGLIYGVGGNDNSTRIFRYDRRTRGFEILGQVADKKDVCFRPHDMVIVGRTAYVAETDNPGRSGFLWVCKF